MWTTLLAAAVVTTLSLDSELASVAAIRGDPSLVAAAGLTPDDARILTLENPDAFDASSKRRVVVVGLPGSDDNARAVLDVVRWFKQRAPARVRRDWTMSAMPSAAFGPADRASYERWVTFQAADLIVEIGGAIAPGGAVPEVERRIGAAAASRSDAHDAIARRVSRDPLQIARLLARRYPETPSISYIPSVAWANTLRLAASTNDAALTQKVRDQTARWVSRADPLFGNRIQLTAVAGTMIFGELGGEAMPLALEGARLASARKDNGIAEYGQGWTDDMFMTSVILARAAAAPDGGHYLDAMAQLLTSYAERLQRPDGVFIHATDGPFAWGRGNGFAALGLMEALTALPNNHPARARLLDVFSRLMSAAKANQSPDGAWRQVLDEPGAYREETATAMLMTAMARGIRLGWIDQSYRPIVERAWRAVAAHVREDGTLVDVCTGTGAGPTRKYYLDRQAITGADDRGGAMALFAAMEIAELRRLSSRRP